jgi:Protein of unknown function (DUF3108)
MKLKYIHQFVCGLVIAMAVTTAATSTVQAQKNLALEVNTLTAGEELVFEAEFSRAVLRKVDVADFHFRTRRDTVPNDAGAPVTSWRLIGDVTSKGIFSKLFNIRLHEHIESSVDPATFSVLRTSKVDEQGKRVRHSEAIFDQAAGKVTWTERDPNNPRQEPRVMTAAFAGTIHDVVSAIYFMRIQPLEVGKGFEIQISDSGRIYQLPVKVVERREMKTLLGRIGVVRVDADIFGEDRLIRGKGKFSIWLSDDARHIPVRADLSTDVGKFEIKLKKTSVMP